MCAQERKLWGANVPTPKRTTEPFAKQTEIRARNLAADAGTKQKTQLIIWSGALDQSTLLRKRKQKSLSAHFQKKSALVRPLPARVALLVRPIDAARSVQPTSSEVPLALTIG